MAEDRKFSLENLQIAMAENNAKLKKWVATQIGELEFIDPIDYANNKYGLEDAPIGQIISYMGLTAPRHYLVCDGTEYNITDYPHLSKHILEEFGSYNYFGGDGQSTFCVPDLRGEFLRGSGTALRETGTGEDVGKHQDPTQNDFYGINLPDNVDTQIIDKTKQSEKILSAATDEVRPINTYTSRPTNTAVLFCIKCEPTYYIVVNKSTTQEEVDLLKQQVILLQQEILQLSEILDAINKEVV